MVNNKH